MDQINANLDRISELSDDELKSLEGSIVSEFEAVQTQDLTPDVVESMKLLARAAVAVRNEVAQREAQAQQLAMEAAEAAQAIKGIDPDMDGDVDNVLDGDSDGDAGADADADADGNADDSDDDASSGADNGTVAEAIESIGDVDNDDVAADQAPSDDTADTTTPDASAAPADADMADEAPAPGTDDADAPAAPDAETPSSDSDADQGGSETPEQGDLSEEDEKKVASFDSTAPASDDADQAPADSAPAEDPSEAAATAPADGDDTTQPAEAPAADEAAEMSETGPDATEPAPSDSSDEADDEDKKNNSEDPVTASVTNELDNLDVQAPADHAPVVASAVAEGPEYAPVTITAGADIPGIQAGAELPDMLSVANALISRKRSMGRTVGGDGEMHHVAQFSTVFPESRQLSPSDIDGNREKIDGAVNSLVAAGGIAAPAEVRYELYGLGEDVRPVKDSLAVFSADRGGIRYITPPVLTDLNGAVSLWTVDDDAAAATGTSPTKPALRVAAGAEVVVQVDAVPLILTFGNMGARAYPELVERHTKLGMIQHARFAETRILTRIGSLSTQVTAGKTLGAARDIFVQVETAAAAYRNRHRMDEKTPLRAIFPAWFKNALRADLVKQLPGDGMDETFGLADATINNWFSLRGINVTWTVDGETGQILGAQAAGALNSFPSTLVWYLFSEGTFLFLDGGTLDLGIVRDSTLNATNDYKIFFETFEAVALVGIESLRVTSDLAIAGATTGTVAPTV